MTRHDLNTRLFAAELDCCNSPDDILNLLQKQAFSRFSKEDEKLLAWLNPAVLFSSRFQQRLAKVIGLVGRFALSSFLFFYMCFAAALTRARMIPTGIGVLL